MRPCLFFTVACFITLRAAAQAPEKPAPKEVPPETKKLFQSTPEEFIKCFDKNMNGTLEKDELPPKLADASRRWTPMVMASWIGRKWPSG